MTSSRSVAVVTGAGGGIGRVVVERLAGQGIRVIAADRQAELLDEMGATGSVETIVADLSTREGAQAVIQGALEAFGTPTILVNTVGGMRGPMQVPFTELDDEQWDFAMTINLRTTFQSMQAALRVMIPERNGRIVNLASTAWAGSPDRADYSAAKAGVVALSRSVATQVAEHGIAVNVVAPGVTLTDAVRPYFESVSADVPLGRWNEPSDVADAVEFLCSNGARNVSGQVLTVAGGWNPSI